MTAARAGRCGEPHSAAARGPAAGFLVDGINAWCPRLTAAMILSGSAVHVKGFGWALVSARKRLMAA